MRIIIIGPAHPYRGGIADTNEALCRELIRSGHDASLLTFTFQYPSFLFPGKTQYSSDPAPGGLSIQRKIHTLQPFNWIGTAQDIKRQNPDLVIIRYWLPFLAPSLGTIARRVRKCCKVVALCDNIIPHEHRPGDRLLTRYFINSCDAFIAMSGTVAKELKEFTDKPVLLTPHPINDQFGEPVSKQVARNYLDIPADQRTILFFGLVRKYKGLDLLLKALAEETVARENIHLIIAGEFYDDPDIYHRLIEQLHLKDRVRIINEFIPAKDIKYYFCASDLMAQTYHTASQSGVTQIAYHFDTPMLVTDVGGLSEMIPDGKVGFVVQKDPKEIARAIKDFYENNLFKKMQSGIKEEKKKYSWSVFVEKLLKFVNG